MYKELMEFVESIIYIEYNVVVFKDVGYIICDTVEEAERVCVEQRYLTIYEILNNKI